MKSWFWMYAFDWPEQTLKIYIQYILHILPVTMTCAKLGAIFSLRKWLVQSFGARLFGNTFLNFVLNFSLERGNGNMCMTTPSYKWFVMIILSFFLLFPVVLASDERKKRSVESGRSKKLNKKGNTVNENYSRDE